MSYSINLGSLLGSTLAIVLGLYALRIAWLAIHLKRNVVSPMDRIAVQLQRILGRSEAAARLEDELRSPRYVSPDRLASGSSRNHSSHWWDPCHSGCRPQLAEPGSSCAIEVSQCRRGDEEGRPRLTPGISQTDRGYTGQQSLAAAGLQDYNARWFDSSLGAFASPDSLVQYVYSPQALNRYSYVLNNPLTYSDPTGHRACEGPMGECWYTDPNPEIGRMPVRGWEPTIASQQVPPTPPQTEECTGSVACMDAYQTYVELVDLLGQTPTVSELLFMTAGAEYWDYVDYQVIQRTGHWTMRSAGREALARNFYQACGEEGYCTPDELYRFFSGFEPWIGDVDDPEPEGGYGDLASDLRERLDQEYANTSEQLWSDVHTILGPEAGDWTTGKQADRPWQWFGPHGDMDHPALVTIAYGTAQYFMMFTGHQDALFKQAIHSE